MASRTSAIRDEQATLSELFATTATARSCALTWDELLACAPEGFDYDTAAAALEPDGLATLIYTLGTTGPPKGVGLTHCNIVAQMATIADRLELPVGRGAVSWLPMAHIAERLCTHYLPMAHGREVTTCSEPRAVAGLVHDVRPEFFFPPPRLWEKLRSGVLA